MRVMVITFEPPGPELSAPAGPAHRFSYYHDRQRLLYRHYGMEMAGFWDLWGPRTLLTYFRLLLRGRKIMPARGDIHQRGGNVLIDPQGRVRFHHIGGGPAGRPDLEMIFELIDGN